jgi:lysyl-tRNA synthetase class 2
MFTIRIDRSVFDRHPGFFRGVVVATGLHNRGPDPGLEAKLRRACRHAAANPLDLANDGRFAVWADAFRSFGSDPGRFSPGHLALRKRVQRAGTELGFINKAVCVMNLQSIEGVLPVGGDDLTSASQFGDLLELRPATGDETFVPLGRPEGREHPEPGEFVLAVNGTVCCRRWCWRNAHPTSIREATTALIMNTDGLGPDGESIAVAARDRVADLLEEHCGASIFKGLLSQHCPEFVVSGVSPGRPWEPTEGW